MALPSTRRVTLKDIARELGITHASVSMALRNHARISAATKERVNAAAKRLGYTPDPRLSALAAYRISQTPVTMREAIVWLEILQPEMPPRSSKEELALRERAAELGYVFDVLVVKPDADSLQKAARVLRARGVRGLVLSCGRSPSEDIPFPWENFCVVQLNGHPASNHLTTVVSNYYRGALLAVRAMAERGYRRIGYWEHWVTPFWAEDHYVGGFRQGMRAYFGELNPPIHRVPTEEDGSHDQGRKMRAWADEQGLDALLESGSGNILPELARGREKLPPFGVACLALETKYPRCAGLSHELGKVARTAIDQLHALMLFNRTGPPEPPLAIQLTGTWRDGESLPSRIAAKPAPAPARRKKR